MKNVVLYVPPTNKTKELFRETRGFGQVPIWWRLEGRIWQWTGGLRPPPGDHFGGWAVGKAVVLHDPTDEEAGVMGCVRMSIVFKLPCIESSYLYWQENPNGGRIVVVDSDGNEVA